jgi:hypothetical protein
MNLCILRHPRPPKFQDVRLTTFPNWLDSNFEFEVFTATDIATFRATVTVIVTATCTARLYALQGIQDTEWL